MESSTDGFAVEIHGKKYVFAAECRAEEDDIRDVANLVKEKISQVSELQQLRSPLHHTVLAAMSLVDELLRLRAECDTSAGELTRRTARLTTTLGELFQGEEAVPERRSVDERSDVAESADGA